MEYGERPKKSPAKKIILAIILIAAFSAVIWWNIPVPLLPKDYREMTIAYVMIGDKTYKPEDGWPTEEQMAKIEEILRPCTMRRTYEAIDFNEVYKLYMPLKIVDKDGFTKGSVLMIRSDMSAKSRALPLIFFDLYTHIDNGAEIYQQIMDILGTPPGK